MSLYVEASVGMRVVGTLEIVNVTPCEHMSKKSCRCVARYRVVKDGRKVRKNIKHKRSDPALALVRKALEVCT